MNPFRTLRDWWHRPVTDRLDAIETALKPQMYMKGVGLGDVQHVLREMSPTRDGRRSWA